MNKGGKGILFAAGVSLALACILSCSSDETSYSYCIIEANKICLDGPFIADLCSGQLSNSCPFSSSSESPSSGSVVVGNDACPDATTVNATDIANGSVTCGGQTYETVKIGTQVWMKNNLNYAANGSKCGNGTLLSDGNTETCDTYGRLYNWATAICVCPQGWHIPGNAEWDQLYRFADGTTGTSSPYFSFSAGKHLKAQTGWNNNGNGLDTHGFSAMPGGYGSSISFGNVGRYGDWWSSSEYDAAIAYTRGMRYSGEYAVYDYYDKTNLFSVRCIQDHE